MLERIAMVQCVGSTHLPTLQLTFVVKFQGQIQANFTLKGDITTDLRAEYRRAMRANAEVATAQISND